MSLLVIFAGAYGLIVYTLQTFIYRKIKLIYKFIYQTKASKREEFYYKNLLPQKSIDEVREDVRPGQSNERRRLNCYSKMKPTAKSFYKT